MFMNPNLIPKEKLLLIPEPESEGYDFDPMLGRVPTLLTRKVMLQYNVLIHIVFIEGFNFESGSSSDSRAPPSSDGDSGHGGRPEKSPIGSYDASNSRGRYFRFHDSVPDGNAPLGKQQRKAGHH